MNFRNTIRIAALGALLGASALVMGCSSKPATQPPATQAPAPAPAPVEPAQPSGLYTPKYAPNGDEIAVITTNKGVIKVQLTGKDTPIHVGNFVELAQKGFYDGVKFHRYVPGFVVQGGDPQTAAVPADELTARAGDPRSPYGKGGPGYTIKGEFATNPNNVHVDGALGMARSQNPDSAGSQFYFCLGAQPDLDSGYTVFGTTIEGRDVIDLLRIGDEITSVTIENAKG